MRNTIAVTLADPADLAGWRDAARALLQARVAPDGVAWSMAGDAVDLFASPMPPPIAPAPAVPQAFLQLAESAIQHSDPARFALLYAVLWRIAGGQRRLLEDPADPAIARLSAMRASVRRDAHKMHAFVRFRSAPDGRFVAWFEPDHHIVAAEAGFFVRRFAGMRWSILTPRACAHWDGVAVTLTPGACRQDAPAEDATEDLWRTYFAGIFNPARLKPAAMRSEMPEKYWANLPEARLIPQLIAEAPARLREMIARGATPAAPRRQSTARWRGPKGRMSPPAD